MEGFYHEYGYRECDSMSNVIVFPQHRVGEKAAPAEYETGAKTLFLHIRNTTMIVHLAAQRRVVAAGGRVGKKS